MRIKLVLLTILLLIGFSAQAQEKKSIDSGVPLLELVAGDKVMVEKLSNSYVISALSDSSCTQANLIKALKMASERLKDPNPKPESLMYGGGITLETPIGYLNIPQSPADQLRNKASQLENEAKRYREDAAKIEFESRNIQWIRSVLANCEKEK